MVTDEPKRLELRQVRRNVGQGDSAARKAASKRRFAGLKVCGPRAVGVLTVACLHAPSVPAVVRRAEVPGRGPGNLAGTVERWESKVSIFGALAARYRVRSDA